MQYASAIPKSQEDYLMSRNTEQKIKLLILYEILQKKTDETNPMTTQELISALKERGIEVSRKTLYEDIQTLNEYGYEVLCDRSRANRYYIGSRRFERTEVQVLLNTIGATHILTNKKTAVLMEKLSELIGVTEAERLQKVVAIGQKHGNERIYYSIDAVTTAILEHKKLSFLYFDYDEHCKKVYRKEKTRYIVNPLGITAYGDNLYLICYHDKYGNTANYRLDRMDEAQVESEEITYIKEYENFDVSTYRNEQFGMYYGEQKEIELIFPRDLIEVAIDRFGEDLKPVSIGNEEYIIKATIQISKIFFSWLTCFEGRVRINSPESVREEYRDYLKNILEQEKSFKV